MGFRTISVSDEIYKKLVSLKHGRESFNEFFERLWKREKLDLKKFFGTWKMSDLEQKEMNKDLKKMWGSWNENIRH